MFSRNYAMQHHCLRIQLANETTWNADSVVCNTQSKVFTTERWSHASKWYC